MKKQNNSKLKIFLITIFLISLVVGAYISLPAMSKAFEVQLQNIKDAVKAITPEVGTSELEEKIREHRGHTKLGYSYEAAEGTTGLPNPTGWVTEYLEDAYNGSYGWQLSLRNNASIFCQERGVALPHPDNKNLKTFHIGRPDTHRGGWEKANKIGDTYTDYIEHLKHDSWYGCTGKNTLSLLPANWEPDGVDPTYVSVDEFQFDWRSGNSSISGDDNATDIARDRQFIQHTLVTVDYEASAPYFDPMQSYYFSYSNRAVYTSDPAQWANWTYKNGTDPGIGAELYNAAAAVTHTLYGKILTGTGIKNYGNISIVKPEMSNKNEAGTNLKTGTVLSEDQTKYVVGPIYMKDYTYAYSENVKPYSGTSSLGATNTGDAKTRLGEEFYKGLICGIIEMKIDLDNETTLYVDGESVEITYSKIDRNRADFSNEYYEAPARHSEYVFPSPKSEFYINIPISQCVDATSITNITIKYKWTEMDGEVGDLTGTFHDLEWTGNKQIWGCDTDSGYDCTNYIYDSECQSTEQTACYHTMNYYVHQFDCGKDGYCDYCSDYYGRPTVCNGGTWESGQGYHQGGLKGCDCHITHDSSCKEEYYSCDHECDEDCTIDAKTGECTHYNSCDGDCSYDGYDYSNCWNGGLDTHIDWYNANNPGCYSTEKFDDYCNHGFTGGVHTCKSTKEHSRGSCSNNSWGDTHIGDCYGCGDEGQGNIDEYNPSIDEPSRCEHGHAFCAKCVWKCTNDTQKNSQKLTYVKWAEVYEKVTESYLKNIPLVVKVEIDKFIMEVKHENETTPYFSSEDRKDLEEDVKEDNPVYVETEDFVTYKLVLTNHSAFGVKVRADDILPDESAYKFISAYVGGTKLNDIKELRKSIIQVNANSEASITITIQVIANNKLNHDDSDEYENLGRIITRNGHDKDSIDDPEPLDVDYVRTVDDDGPVVNHEDVKCNGTTNEPDIESKDWFKLNNYNAFIDKYVYSYNESEQKDNNDILGISKEDSVIGEDGQLVQEVDGKDVSRRNLTKTTKNVSDGNVDDIIRTDDKAKEEYKGQHPVNVEQGEKITYAIRVSNEAKEIAKSEPTGTKPATALKDLRIKDVMHEGLIPTKNVTGKIFEYVNGVDDTEISDLGAMSLSGANGEYYITALSGENDILKPNQYVEFYIEVDVKQSNMYLPSMENSAELVAASNINDVVIYDKDNKDTINRMISEQTISKEFVRMKDLLIAGYVWLDNDQNGLMDEDLIKTFDKDFDENKKDNKLNEEETKLLNLFKVNNNINDNARKEDVVVRLYRVEGDTGTEIRKTKTDENGLYTFARAEDDESWYDTFNHTVDYEADGDGVNAGKYQRIDKADGKDEYGNYKADSKYYSYYVEFEYDGVLYRSTEIYADNKNLNNDGSFKSEEYTIDSNAMELTTDREEFNNRYEYISYNVAYDMNLNKDEKTGDLVFQKDGHSSYLMENTERAMTAKSFITEETELIKYLWLYHINGGKDDYGYFYPNTNYLKYINLGLELREDVDLALTKDVYNLKTTVNGEEMEYDFNLGDTPGFLNDYIVKKPYGFEIYESDYKYRVEQYIANAVEAYKGINGEDELNIEITYRINLQNLTTKDDEEMAALDPDNPEVNKNTPLYVRVHEILDLYDENFMELTGNDADDTVNLKVKNEEGFLEDKTIKVAEAWMFMTKEEAAGKELLEDGQTYKVRKASDGTNTSNNDIYVEDAAGDFVKVKLEMSHASSRGVDKEGKNEVFSAKVNNFKDDGYNTAYIRGMEDQVIPEGGEMNIYVKYVVDKDKLEITVDEDYETTTTVTREALNTTTQKVENVTMTNNNISAVITEILTETIVEEGVTQTVTTAKLDRSLRLKDKRVATNPFKQQYGRGTENIAQVDAYSVWYDEAGTVPASLVDKDSNAGNIGIKNTSTNASPNGSGYSEETTSADDIEFYEDTTYKTGIELAAEGTEQTRDEVEKEYDIRIPEVDRIIEITTEYDLIRKITGKVWDDSRSTALGSGNEIQYVGDGEYKLLDDEGKPITKLTEAKDNKNVELNYKEPEVTEEKDIAVRNAKAEFIEIVKIPRKNDEGNYILDAAGNKQFDYYEEVLTDVTWDQVQNARTGENGEYTLEGFKPGRYIVRFTYGDVDEKAKTTDGIAVWDKIQEFDDRIEALSERTDLTTEKAIYEEKEKILDERNKLLESDQELLAVKDMLIFNGQDYKSTKYTGVQDDPTLKEDEIIQAFQEPNNSDARDDEVRRLEVNAYSEVMTNEMAEILKGLVNGNKTYTPNSTANTSSELKALTDNTYMKADTVEFLIKPEKLIETETINQKPSYSLEYMFNEALPYYKYLTALKNEHIKERDFTIENVDFGIEYRPESQISLMKEIKEITLKTTAKNGETDVLVNLHFTTEGDGVNRTHKIIEEDSIGYELVQFITNNYTDKTLINNVMSEESLQGLVYIQVDEEVLQGCTIEITYGFDAQNNSEIDRISKQLNAIRYRDNKATDDLIKSYETKYAGQAHKAFSLFDLTHIQNTKYTASALSKAAVFADTFALDEQGLVYREIPKTTTTNGDDGYYGRFVGHGYYIGEVSDLDTISSLKFDKILDYIDTNLEYEQKTNSEEMTNKLWSKIDSGELVGLVSYYKGIRNSINGLTFDQIQNVKSEFTNKLKETNGAFTTSVTVADKVIELERKITDGYEELFVDDVKFDKVTNMDGIEYKSMVVSVDDRNVDPGDPNDKGDVKNKDLSKFLLPKVSLVGMFGEDDVDSPEYEKYTGHIYLDVSKVLAAGSDADDKTYENMAEIVQFTTLNGRRTNFATTIGNADIKAIKEKLDNDLPPFESVEPGNPKNPGSIEFITASIEPDTSATETITLIPPTGLMRSRRPIVHIMEATKTGIEVMSIVGLVVAIILAIGAVVVYTTRRVQRKRIK